MAMSFELGNAIGYVWTNTRLHGRCGVLTGPDTVTDPTAGGDVDGVSAVLAEEPGLSHLYYFIRGSAGQTAQVEAAASFGAGAMLQTDADGRVRPATSGKPILRALESATVGGFPWCVFTSGR